MLGANLSIFRRGSRLSTIFLDRTCCRDQDGIIKRPLGQLHNANAEVTVDKLNKLLAEPVILQLMSEDQLG